MTNDGERPGRDERSDERVSERFSERSGTRLEGGGQRRGQLGRERKGLYYVGGAIAALGLVLFFSTFFVVGCAIADGFGDSTSAPFGPTGPDANIGAAFLRSMVGFVLIVVGKGLQSVGARGLRGSGVILDPDGARDDLAPYSRMAGGMLGDAVEASGIDLGQRSAGAPEIMVRCLACDQLNEEDSKFCQECGEPL